MDNMRWSSSSVWKNKFILVFVETQSRPHCLCFKRPLHSGHYGNWASCNDASAIISFNEDDDGRVTIKGFYDDVIPLGPSEKLALLSVPSVDNQMKTELGMGAPEMKGVSLNEAINLPSLNINGMQSGNVGKMASNQIPTTANAVLDLD
jgi:hypothetical protein